MEMHDLFGIFGVALVVATYFFLHIGYLSATNIYYSLLNMTGSGLILVSLSNDFNLSSCLIESIWVLISIIGVVRYIYLRKYRNKTNGLR